MSKVKKGIEIGHMTSLGEIALSEDLKRVDGLTRETEENDQKMRSDLRHLVFLFLQRSPAFHVVLKIPKSNSLPI